MRPVLSPLRPSLTNPPLRTIIDLSADRGAFIDQSQSLNIHLSSPTMYACRAITYSFAAPSLTAPIHRAQLTSMHFYGWKKGLKTGMVRSFGTTGSFAVLTHLLQYYLRTRAAVGAVKFTVDQATIGTSAQPHFFRILSKLDYSPPAQAKADNSKAAAPKAALPSPAPSPMRDLTNGVVKVTLASPSPAKRFESPPPVAAAPAPVIIAAAAAASLPTPAASEASSSEAPSEDGEDISYEEAIKRREAKELADATLMCSLENKGASFRTLWPFEHDH